MTQQDKTTIRTYLRYLEEDIKLNSDYECIKKISIETINDIREVLNN